MPIKKKGKGKKGKKKKSKKDDGPPPEPFVFEPVVFDSVNRDEWVTCHVKLVTWNYLNFSVRIKTNTPIFNIKNMIVKRQGGSVSDIVVYNRLVHPQNEIEDENETLADLGVDGDASRTGMSECVLYYDFRPNKSICPLLQCDPRLIVGEPHKKLLRPLSAPSRVSDTRRESGQPTGYLRPQSAMPGVAEGGSRNGTPREGGSIAGSLAGSRAGSRRVSPSGSLAGTPRAGSEISLLGSTNGSVKGQVAPAWESGGGALPKALAKLKSGEVDPPRARVTAFG